MEFNNLLGLTKFTFFCQRRRWREVKLYTSKIKQIFPIQRIEWPTKVLILDIDLLL